MRLILRTQGGLSLVELMITFALLGILVSLGLPSYRDWIQNSQIRTASESLLAGVQLARAEAVRRNRAVRFFLINNLSGCTASSSGTSWTISVGATAICNTGHDDFIQSRNVSEGTASASITGTNSTGGAASSVAFDGVGRIVSSTLTTALVRVRVDSIALNATDSRDLEIRVSPGGEIRMCDPNVTASTDARKC